jgi:hypothetical protein
MRCDGEPLTNRNSFADAVTITAPEITVSAQVPTPSFAWVAGFDPPSGYTRDTAPSLQSATQSANSIKNTASSAMPSLSGSSGSANGSGGAHSIASTGASIPIGATVGASLGGVLLIIAVLWCLCHWRRRRRSGTTFMSEDGQMITAGSMHFVDTSSSSIQDVAPRALAPGLGLESQLSKRGRAAARVRQLKPVTDSKTLAAARRAVINAASSDERGRPMAENTLSDASPAQDTPWTPPPPVSESDQDSVHVLWPTRGVDHDPYFQALHVERARVDAELARLREEYAEGAPPTYISDNGSGGAPTDQTADGTATELHGPLARDSKR